MQSDEGRPSRVRRTKTWRATPAWADYLSYLAIEDDGSGAIMHLHFTCQFVSVETLILFVGHFKVTADGGAEGKVARIAQLLARASAVTGNTLSGTHVGVLTHFRQGASVILTRRPGANTAHRQANPRITRGRDGRTGTTPKRRRASGGVLPGPFRPDGLLYGWRGTLRGVRGRRPGFAGAGGCLRGCGHGRRAIGTSSHGQWSQQRRGLPLLHG